MLSINTNLPSLTAQRSLTNSTKLLNQAIERMSTGFKINHASDNAANYSISTNMTTKIGAYEVAEDNVASGLDLLATAEGSLDLISDKLTRLRALAEQAANGTYGEQSLKAINSEANAIVDEIERVYSTTEYNGIKLFSEAGGNFINQVQRRDTSSMTKLSSVDPTQSLTSGTYSISTAEELAQLATMTNNGKIDENTEFVLANNIDLSAYNTDDGWVPIGGDTLFSASFDGNGYTISNMFIYGNGMCGLFGNTYGGCIKNLGVENCDVLTTGYFAGCLVGYCAGTVISNCYVTGTIYNDSGDDDSVGAFVGGNEGEIYDCYVKCNINRYNSGDIGSFVGVNGGEIERCYYDLESNLNNPGVNDISIGLNENEFKELLSKTVKELNFQVGIDGQTSSVISCSTDFDFDSSFLRGIGQNNDIYLNRIDSLISTVNSKQTEYGAIQNRLESALEEISTQYDNLVSSRSTLRDADIAEVSSEYIRQQILQQASATLLATANQSPALALQLL